MRLGQSFADTNTGRKRRHNEDAFVCQPPLFAVADGMGGAQAGEVASALAADTLRYGETELDAGEPAEYIAGLIQSANERVYRRANDDATASGMGTTMTAALFQADGRIVIGHVGDSRAYVLRDGTLEQLTDDHSLVAELVRRGELSPAEAELHPQRSVITRALGTDPNVDVDTFVFQARPGDVFLLCSDGLTSMVDEATISEIVARYRFQLEAASRSLIKAANDRGGEDNITTVLFSVEPELDGGAAASPAKASESHGPAPDEEDTLHPEDRVPAVAEPVASDHPLAEPAQPTMVLSPEEISAALRGDRPTEPASSQDAASPDAASPAPPEERRPVPLPPPDGLETPAWPVPPDPAEQEAPSAQPGPVGEAPPEPLAFLDEAQPRPPLGRRLLAAAVIAALVAVIVLLLVKGLTR